jgi:hypothetical protein
LFFVFVPATSIPHQARTPLRLDPEFRSATLPARVAGTRSSIPRLYVGRLARRPPAALPIPVLSNGTATPDCRR